MFLHTVFYTFVSFKDVICWIFVHFYKYVVLSLILAIIHFLHFIRLQTFNIGKYYTICLYNQNDVYIFAKELNK